MSRCQWWLFLVVNLIVSGMSHNPEMGAHLWEIYCLVWSGWVHLSGHISSICPTLSVERWRNASVCFSLCCTVRLWPITAMSRDESGGELENLEPRHRKSGVFRWQMEVDTADNTGAEWKASHCYLERSMEKETFPNSLLASSFLGYWIHPLPFLFYFLYFCYKKNVIPF